ncbi:MAG TPA: hypothetical protein ENK02_02980 [Planctomycetes bacterium]|nr:hypothetical protein [Planctomycetota bacterium]
MYPHERSLVKKLKNKPFTLVGVNSDPDLLYLHERMKAENITWPSFTNGPYGTSGPIAARWGVRGWPTIYILDHKGVIRFKNLRGKRMEEAVEKLLEEMAEKQGN